MMYWGSFQFSTQLYILGVSAVVWIETSTAETQSTLRTEFFVSRRHRFRSSEIDTCSLHFADLNKVRKPARRRRFNPMISSRRATCSVR